MPLLWRIPCTRACFVHPSPIPSPTPQHSARLHQKEVCACSPIIPRRTSPVPGGHMRPAASVNLDDVKPDLFFGDVEDDGASGGPPRRRNWWS